MPHPNTRAVSVVTPDFRNIVCYSCSKAHLRPIEPETSAVVCYKSYTRFNTCHFSLVPN